MKSLNIHQTAFAFYRLLIFAFMAFYFISMLLFGPNENDAPDNSMFLYQLYLLLLFVILEFYHKSAENQLKQIARYVGMVMLTGIICFDLWQHCVSSSTDGWITYMLIALSFDLLQIFVLTGLIRKKI